MKLPVKILICGTPISGNKGGAALVSGAVQAISKHVPGAQFTLLSMKYAEDAPNKDRYGVGVAAAELKDLPTAFLLALLWRVLDTIGVKARSLIDGNRVLRHYAATDIVVNMTGVGFHDFFGKLVIIKHVLWVLPAVLIKKPIVLYSQSMGPFTTRFNRVMAKLALNAVDAIGVRGGSSYDNLVGLKIKVPVFVYPDVGFLLKPIERPKALGIIHKAASGRTIDGPLICVAPNKVIDQKLKDDGYVDILAKALDIFIELKPSASVIFVPHAIIDLDIADRVSAKTKNGSKVIVIQDDLPAEELKAVIGVCDFFLGSRFHAVVAALSMAVPTVVVGWSHKYHELMGLFGQDDLILDFDSISEEGLRGRLKSLVNGEQRIRQELNGRTAQVRESALSSGKIIADVLEKHYGNHLKG